MKPSVIVLVILLDGHVKNYKGTGARGHVKYYKGTYHFFEGTRFFSWGTRARKIYQGTRARDLADSMGVFVGACTSIGGISNGTVSFSFPLMGTVSVRRMIVDKTQQLIKNGCTSVMMNKYIVLLCYYIYLCV